jgi:hypothetical protein
LGLLEQKVSVDTWVFVEKRGTGGYREILVHLVLWDLLVLQDLQVPKAVWVQLEKLVHEGLWA